MKFTKIPSDTFEKLQINAGVILSSFAPATGTFEAAKQIGATTGGITFAVTHSFTDLGDDVDNCPKNTMELKKLDSWEVKMSGTFVTVTKDSAKQMVGAADATQESKVDKITPRNDVADADFKDIWLVGDYSSKNGDVNGGFIAIHMFNALSTGGFKLKTADKSKGTMSFEFTGHYSLADQTKVPFEIYIKTGADEAVAAASVESGESPVTE